MAENKEKGHWIKVDWPSLFPRSLNAVAKDLGWHVRAESGGPEICLDESYMHRPITPLRPVLLASIGDKHLDLAQLRTWHHQAVDDWTGLRELADRFGRSEALSGRLYGLGLGFTTAPPSELPGFVERFLAERLPEMAGGKLLLVEADIRLYYMQMTVAKLLYRAAHLPHLFFPRQEDEPGSGFGQGLDSHDVLGGGLFLQPAAAAASPDQLGFVAARASGCLFLCYPRPIRSPDSALPRTLAELVQPHYFLRPRACLETRFELPDVDIPEFLYWWIGRVNNVLGQFLNPATHRDREGLFSPALMIGRFVSLQRLLSAVQAILVETSQNEFVRMGLLFDALDLFENMGGGLGGWGQLTNAKQTQLELDRLKGVLGNNKAAEEVVIPRCERAVEALLELRDCLEGSAGNSRASPEGDLSSMLRALRNAGHGLAGGRGPENLRTLMGKGVQIPADLPDLAWLHLARAVCLGDWSPRY